MAGYIQVDRKILQWGWYQDIKVFHFFLYLLLRANHKDGSWKGTLVKRGQVIIGREKASKDTGLTESEIRTCIKKLKMTSEITTNSTNKNTLITICKYDIYQSNNYSSSPAESPTAAPTNRQQIATNNNVDNKKEEIKKGFNTKPVYTDFNGLPESFLNSAIEIRYRTKGNKAGKEDTLAMWEAWKIKSLTGHEYYANEGKVYGHFIDWFKFQEIKPNAPKSEKLPDANQLAKKYER